MSQTEQKTPLAVARAHAQRIAEALTPGAYRLEIAGSIRREAPLVSDIEIVAISDYEAAPGLFPGQEQRGPSKLDAQLAKAVETGLLGAPVRNGDRWRTYPTPGIPEWFLLSSNALRHRMSLDLFIVEPWAWGVMLAIRTGPAGFSKAIVTQQSLGGKLHDNCIVRNGRVWSTCHAPALDTPTAGIQQFNTAPEGQPERWVWFQAQDTDEEEKFFDYVIGGYVEPQKR